MAHDDHSHSGFHHTYKRITQSLYVWWCAHFLRQYIKNCPDCQKNQTTRHKPYGNLKPVMSPLHPFYTVTLDFIVELPPTAIGNGEFDACTTLTCKFSKRILVEPGKTNWSAKDWAIVLITSLISHNWGIPQAIISDRDAKFMSNFSKTVFQKLNTHLLTSTSYHSVWTDKSSLGNCPWIFSYLTSGKRLDGSDSFFLSRYKHYLKRVYWSLFKKYCIRLPSKGYA